MEELITYIVRALVDRPELVEVQSRGAQADGTRLYELKVAPDDVGKVIGRDGRTVSAIRTLLSTAALKALPGQKLRLELLDDRRAAQVAAAASPNVSGTPTDEAS